MRRRGGTEAARLAHALEATAPPQTGDPSVDELLRLTERLSRVALDDGPTPEFRVRTRQRLLALAQREASAGDQRTRFTVDDFRGMQSRWGRRLAFAVAALATILATAGLLTLASRDALPGDTLYAVKRGSEQVQIGLTWDPDERGFALLHFAETRLAEVTELVDQPAALVAGAPRTPVAAGADTHEAVVRTLAEMDRQTTAGVSLLTASAVQSSDEATLQILPTWAAGQQSLLDALWQRMSAPEQDRAEVSLALLERVDHRARMLEQGLPCNCLDETPADELGPMPCPSCGSEPDDSPTPTLTSPVPTSGTPSQPGPGPTGTSPTS